MIPEHVVAAFQLESSGSPLGAPWDFGRKFGNVVVAPASPTAAWSGKTREKLADAIPGLHVARPVRATDGRLVVGGYCANEFAPGAPAARVDEAMAGALLLDEALTPFAPPSPASRTGMWADAERASWRDFDGDVPVGGLVTAHMDFLACCLFAGKDAPVLSTLVPSVEPRPRGYTAAQVMVDGLLVRAVDEGVIGRWAHVPHLLELAERALKYREITGEATISNVRSDISRVRELIVSA